MAINHVFNKIRALRSYIYWAIQLWHPVKRCAYFFGIPTHTNIGDSAIVVAEKKFLEECGYDRIIEITSQEYVSNRKCIRRLLPKSAIIFLPGGGNMGSLWPIEEERRCQIIEDFKEHSITVFPQTIFYGESKEDLALKEDSVRIYNSAIHMTIVAREKVSYDIMRTLYPKCKILLTPDIVLSLGHQSFHQCRNGILICFRNDKEKKVSSTKLEQLFRALKRAGYYLSVTDTIANGQITEMDRAGIVQRKMRQISSSRLLITDRLHGMVFAAITGTPCIVFENSYHKVSGTYEWLKDLEYIEFVSDVYEAEAKVSDLYYTNSHIFQMENDVFETLRSHIVQDMNQRGKYNE